MPLTLSAAPQTIAMPDATTFAFPGDAQTADLRAQLLGGAYGASGGPLAPVAASTLGALTLLESPGLATYAPEPGVTYPDTEFGARLRSAAALIKADIGLEAIVVEYGEWDHHSAQGPVAGEFADHLREFAEAVAAFDADCAPVSDRLTLLAHSAPRGRAWTRPRSTRATWP